MEDFFMPSLMLLMLFRKKMRYFIRTEYVKQKHNGKKNRIKVSYGANPKRTLNEIKLPAVKLSKETQNMENKRKIP